MKGLELNTAAGLKQAFAKNFNYLSNYRIVLPVGSGYCAGVFGGATGAIDSLGFAMLIHPPYC